MSGIVQAKNAINKIYSKYAGYINPCLKFILALLVFFVINNRMGYMEKISGGAVVLLVALFCSFMPLAFMALLEGVFILLHMYALSLEMAAVTAVLLFMMYILFLRFTPKEAVVVLLTPIFFIMKVPYLMPLAVGLLGSPISVISVAFGVIMHYVINFASSNEEMFSSGADQDMVNRIRAIVDGLLANKSMIVVIICFSVVLVLVYVIRKLKINYSWSIAVGAGAFVNLMLMAKSIEPLSKIDKVKADEYLAEIQSAMAKGALPFWENRALYRQLRVRGYAVRWLLGMIGNALTAGRKSWLLREACPIARLVMGRAVCRMRGWFK